MMCEPHETNKNQTRTDTDRKINLYGPTQTDTGHPKRETNLPITRNGVPRIYH